MKTDLSLKAGGVPIDADTYLKVGRWLFAAFLLGVGLLQLTSGKFMALFPVDDKVPLGVELAYLTGLLLVIAAVLIVTKKYALPGTYIAVVVFFISLFFLNIPMLVMHWSKDLLTFPAENLIFFSGSLMLCGNILVESGNPRKGPIIFTVGKYLFALALFDFGVEHLISESSAITFIPAWIPWKTFWCYLVMCAFFAASISLFINKLAKLAMEWLFLMFFLWICLLHGPDVAGNLSSAFAWLNFFVPVGVCGIALSLAGWLRKGL
jgi:hypothetical protein